MVKAMCLLLALTAVAQADKLDDARVALDNVQYDEARELLDAALVAGGSSPVALAEIYRLRASTAIVLGDADAARAAYRRWLALDPKASLPSTAAVKFQDPFVAAQAFTAANGPLAIKIGTAGDMIAVSVMTDPLKLAVSVALDGGARIPIAKRVTLRVPSRNTTVRVVVFDEHGNQLVSRAFANLAAVPDEVVVTTTPLYRQWPVWASAAVVTLAGGLYFQRRAVIDDGQLDSFEGSEGKVFFTEVEKLERSRDRNQRAAIGLFAGAAVFTAAAALAFKFRPHRETVITPTVDGSPGISVRAAF